MRSRTFLLFLFLCYLLCLPARLVVAASNDSHDLAALENELPVDKLIIQAASQPVFTSAQGFIRESCQQVTGEVFDGNSTTLPASWLAYSDSTDDSSVQPATEAVERRGQQVGTRYTWLTRLLDEVQLSVLGTPARPVLTLQIGDEFPVLRLLIRGDCSVVNAQRVEYRRYKSATDEAPSRMLAYQLQSLDEQGDAFGEPQLLNPEIEFEPGTQSDVTEAIVPVAMIDSGVNYLLPEIADKLLRDPSGQMAGYDYWDNDDRPFDLNLRGSIFNIQRHGTRTASLVMTEAPAARVAPFRFPRPHMHRMRELLAHIDSLDIKLVGMALGGNREEEWEAFEQAAKQYPEMLFVVSAGNNGRNIDQEPVYPAALHLANMIVVTSADDSTLPARGSNWGRGHVDYLLPAEHVNVLDFDGTQTRVSGSSYAVSRMVALLVRLQTQNPDWVADDFKAELRRRFNDGKRARFIGGGYIGDPLSVAPDQVLIEELSKQQKSGKVVESFSADSSHPQFQLDYEMLVLDSRWDDKRITDIQNMIASVLSQCNIQVSGSLIRRLAVAPHLATMSIGNSRTLLDHVRPDKPSIVLTTITRTLFEDNGEAYRYDAEAFGRGNTRGRDWLRDTVWISQDVQDAGLAAVHELVHVLMNDGGHVDQANNLMNTKTALNNRLLNSLQCRAMHDNGLSNGLLVEQEG